MKMKSDIPFGMLFVRFATVTYRLCSKLDETVIELTVCPVESSLRVRTALKNTIRPTHLGYEVSPSPKDANLIRCKHPGRSRALRNAFQKTWLFGGRSPCPVVDIESRTTWCCSSCFCKKINHCPRQLLSCLTY